jgi:hypothetical protein
VPTQSGFLEFVRVQMGVPTSALPDDSFFLMLSYEIALLTVNQWFNCVGLPQIYVQMVYNLGGDILIGNAMDLPSPPAPTYGEPPLGYFANLRRTWNVNGFVSGVVTSANDQGTGATYAVSEALSALTLADLQNMKTPWGRQYLAWAQQFGSGLWGIS